MNIKTADRDQLLYLECASGISGDMTVAALLDLGADKEVLLKTLYSIPDQSFQIRITRVNKSGIDCCDFAVILDEEHENHDHDMEYLHGSGHTHDHSDEYIQHHEDGHHHENEHHHHAHRGLPEIMEILDACDMTQEARMLARKIFIILAKAEAKAHNLPVDKVHFHEVGAIDSIVDIIAAAVCIDNLKIKDTVVKKLCEGTGTVRCQHGILPIPVPASANIMQEYKLPVQIMDVQGEFVTPTGAAIAAAITTRNRLPAQFVIDKLGLGAGKRQYSRPSILRAMLIHETEKSSTSRLSSSVEEDVIWRLESNIDDCSGEALGYVMEKLFDAGARDVHYTPVFMKKNRPAYQLNIICTQDKIQELEKIIFAETTTIGIRRVQMERTVLERSIQKVETPYGEANVKVCRHNADQYIYPEYECVQKIAKNHGIPYMEAYLAVRKAYEEN